MMIKMIMVVLRMIKMIIVVLGMIMMIMVVLRMKMILAEDKLQLHQNSVTKSTIADSGARDKKLPEFCRFFPNWNITKKIKWKLHAVDGR